MRVFLRSIGCRLNRSEIERLTAQFVAAGCTVVEDAGAADVCVVNTCVVTAQAERKSRAFLQSLHRSNPRGRIAAVGCYATLAPHKVARLPGVAWVVTNREKERTLELMFQEVVPPVVRGETRDLPCMRTRAFLKVQEGCDNRCTYCIVRSLRGPARSFPLQEVVEEVKRRVAAGYREVVLTGINLGAYGRDLGLDRGLATLVETLLARTTLPRLRLSSLEPWDVDEAFLELWADPRLCRQLHLPLQSGHDGILQRMGRPITTGQYARLAETARSMIPDLALTSDVLVGFPGEDEAAFDVSLDFVARMAFARLHVFPFSPRPETEAAHMKGQVPPAVRQERAQTMRELGERMALRFRQCFVGAEMAVLWERSRRGMWRGLTDNYLPVVVSSPRNLHNRITQTRLLEVRGSQLVGEVKE